MKRCRIQLWHGALVALFAAGTSLGGEPSIPTDPTAILRGLVEQIQALPEPPARLLQDLATLEETVGKLVANLADAQRSEAEAYARMASWTGAILSRELKKVTASARLIEITEQTGRTEEVARYRDRHQRLLDSIADTAAHYASIVRHLGTLNPELVAFGFDQYRKHLIGKELASQLGVHRVVRNQVEQFARSGTADLDAWQTELESL
jgi:chromosome segregation ATPase